MITTVPEARAAAPAVRVPVRRADLEWLRVFAMLMVVGAHSAQVFIPWTGWHVQNPERSAILGQFAVFVWPWVMPLFMLLAGAGARFSLAHRSDEEFGIERTRRLLVPFFAATLLLIPPQIYYERLAQGRFTGSFTSFYPHFFECCYPEGNLAAGHLWFVLYLWVYSVVSLPLLRRLGQPAARQWTRALSRFCLRGNGMIFILALPVVISQVVLRGFFPQSFALIDDWSAHALLFFFFLTGFVLVGEPALMRAVDRQWHVALAVAVAASLWIGVEVARAQTPDALPVAWSTSYVPFWTMFGLAAWAWTVVFIGATRRWLRADNSVLQYASRSVYSVYILHQTVIVIVAYYIIQWDADVAAKFFAILTMGLILTVLAAELGRRWRPTRLLLGTKRAQPPVLTPALSRRAAPRP